MQSPKRCGLLSSTYKTMDRVQNKPSSSVAQDIFQCAHGYETSECITTGDIFKEMSQINFSRRIAIIELVKRSSGDARKLATYTVYRLFVQICYVYKHTSEIT
jgi:hypothetical protein